MEDKKLPVISDDIREKLRAPFPEEAITQHPTKTFLSTIKQIYITERLNDVFGVGRWDHKTEVILDTGTYVLVKGNLVIHDYDCHVPGQYGGHTTTGKNVEIADGYKSAVTDSLSKCASFLEIGIDVFKGKVNPPKTKNNIVNSKFKKVDIWMNEADYNKIIKLTDSKRIKSGIDYWSSVQDDGKQRGMSKAYRQDLEKHLGYCKALEDGMNA